MVTPSPVSWLDRETPEQVLDVVVSPAQTRADEERISTAGAVQEIVPSSGDIDRWREEIAAGHLRVGGEIWSVEVPEVGRETEPVLEQLVVEPRAAARLDDARPQAEVFPSPAEKGGDCEVVLELLRVGRLDLDVPVGERCALDGRGRHPAAERLCRELDAVVPRRVGRIDVQGEVSLPFREPGQELRTHAQVDLGPADRAEGLVEAGDPFLDRDERVVQVLVGLLALDELAEDRKSTRLNSSHI